MLENVNSDEEVRAYLDHHGLRTHLCECEPGVSSVTILRGEEPVAHGAHEEKVVALFLALARFAATLEA